MFIYNIELKMVLVGISQKNSVVLKADSIDDAGSKALKLVKQWDPSSVEILSITRQNSENDDGSDSGRTN